jgi:hypothetical protein
MLRDSVRDGGFLCNAEDLLASHDLMVRTGILVKTQTH